MFLFHKYNITRTEHRKRMRIAEKLYNEAKSEIYDNSNTLVEVGKLSSALNKNVSSEAIVKVRLTY